MASVLDFNNALTQRQLETYLGLDEKPDAGRIDRIREGLAGSAPHFIAWLFPAALFSRTQARIGNTDGDAGTSLLIETAGSKAGLWKDFGDPNQKGGDLIGLYMAAKRRTFPIALEELAEWLGNGTKPDIAYSRQQLFAKAKKVDRDLGPQKGEWHYTDADGHIIASVYRFEPEDGGKEFLPWDAVQRRYGNPEIRPLYNIPGVLQSERVIFCEGEKSAKALIDRGLCATSVMGGANSPLEKTDLSPLSRRDVIIWPDADGPGQEFAGRLALALSDVAASVTIFTPPSDVESGWDAADACEEGLDLEHMLGFAESAAPAISSASIQVLGFDLREWSTDRFMGSAPPIQWLCENTIPQGVPALFAAMGGVGKSFIALDLALEIAAAVAFGDYNARRVLGGEVVSHGSVVVLNAEDSRDSIHRRLERIDPDNRRERANGKVFIVPLPEVGGPMPLITGDKGEFKKTPRFEALIEQLKTIPDLKLLIIDPLQAFVTADITKDPAAGQFMWSCFAQICAATGATVIACHHMRKEGMSKIDSADSAREAIRGSTALIDGARATYALWNAGEDQAKRLCQELGIPHKPKAVVNGAVVKANDEHDWEVHTYVRAESGLLEDRSATAQRVKQTTGQMTEAQALDCLNKIHERWTAGRPFSASSQTADRFLGAFIQREYGLSKSTAKDAMDRWFHTEMIGSEMFDRKAKSMGLRVLKWPS
jgi:hypothetical protein